MPSELSPRKLSAGKVKGLPIRDETAQLNRLCLRDFGKRNRRNATQHQANAKPLLDRNFLS